VLVAACGVKAVAVLSVTGATTGVLVVTSVKASRPLGAVKPKLKTSIVAAVVVSDANVVDDLRRFVRLKVADRLPAVAVTVYEPVLLLAVKVPALATPELLVETVMVPVELENVPLCPALPASFARIKRTSTWNGGLRRCSRVQGMAMRQGP
jgi:hypothetical protein